MARFNLDFGNAMRAMIPQLINRREQARDFRIPSFEDTTEEDEVFKPRTKAYDELNALIDNMPERKEPGFWRRLAAGVTSMGGNAQGAEDIKYGAYNRAMVDWKSKFAGTKEAADNEATWNTNERLIRNQEINERKNRQAAELATRKQEEIERANLTREQQAQQKIDIANRRAEAYIAKTKLGPDWKTVVDEDGEIVAWNPKTLETKKLNIKSNELSDAQKIQMDVEGNLKEIAARHAARLSEIDAQGEQNRQTKETPSGSTTTAKGPTPAAINRELLNRARDIVNAHPELAKYIDTKTGIVKPIRSILNWKSGDVTLRQRAVDMLNGKIEVGNQSKIPTNQSTNPPNDKVIVIAPDGRKGYVPKSRLNEYLANGYKKG